MTLRDDYDQQYLALPFAEQMRVIAAARNLIPIDKPAAIEAFFKLGLIDLDIAFEIADESEKHTYCRFPSNVEADESLAPIVAIVKQTLAHHFQSEPQHAHMTDLVATTNEF